MRPIVYTLLLFVLIFAGCGGGEYSEQEEETLEQAQKAHYQAMDEFADALNKLNVIASLQDSIRTRVDEVSRMADAEGTDTDSLTAVSSSLEESGNQLTDAKNALLEWANSIYGLPDHESVYSKDNPEEEPSIAKDEYNDMLENNIQYKELPEDITPQELLSLQEKQLSEVRSLHRQIEASITHAQQTIAENL